MQSRSLRTKITSSRTLLAGWGYWIWLLEWFINSFIRFILLKIGDRYGEFGPKYFLFDNKLRRFKEKTISGDLLTPLPYFQIWLWRETFSMLFLRSYPTIPVSAVWVTFILIYLEWFCHSCVYVHLRKVVIFAVLWRTVWKIKKERRIEPTFLVSCRKFGPEHFLFFTFFFEKIMNYGNIRKKLILRTVWVFQDLIKNPKKEPFSSERGGTEPKVNILLIENKMLNLFLLNYFFKKRNKFSEETVKNHFMGHDYFWREGLHLRKK